MTKAPQLCLGTVQFGLPYGITNQAGQVPEEEPCWGTAGQQTHRGG